MPLSTVMFITPYFPPHLGGVEQYVLNMARHLLGAGHIARAVVVTTGLADPQWDAYPGLTVHRLPTSFTIANTPVGLNWAKRLRVLMDREQPVLVNAHAPVPVLADVAAVASGRRAFVLTYHAGPMRKGSVAVDVMLRAYERFVLTRTATRAERIICSSAYVKTRMVRSLPGISVVISPGFAPDRFWPSPLPASRRVLFVASLSRATRYKDLETLLQATALLKSQGRPVSLEVVGEGDLLEKYRKRAAELDLEQLVDFRGALHGEGVVEAYHRSDVLVLPSRFDSFPSVVVEAMACARPVIASRVGGLSEIVQNGVNGYLVTPGDPRELSERIADLVSSPARAAAMGREGRSRVTENHTWAGQALRTARVFADAVEENRCRFGGGT
jgi:glycosyltransferase involved in cell wall biosynthesis